MKISTFSTFKKNSFCGNYLRKYGCYFRVDRMKIGNFANEVILLLLDWNTGPMNHKADVQFTDPAGKNSIQI